MIARFIELRRKGAPMAQRLFDDDERGRVKAQAALIEARKRWPRDTWELVTVESETKHLV